MDVNLKQDIEISVWWDLQVPYASGEHSGHQSTQPAFQKDPDPAGSSWYGPCKCHPADGQWNQPLAQMGGMFYNQNSTHIQCVTLRLWQKLNLSLLRLLISLFLNGSTTGTQIRWVTVCSTAGPELSPKPCCTSLQIAWRESSPSRTWRSGRSMRSEFRQSTALEQDPGVSLYGEEPESPVRTHQYIFLLLFIKLFIY